MTSIAIMVHYEQSWLFQQVSWTLPVRWLRVDGREHCPKIIHSSCRHRLCSQFCPGTSPINMEVITAPLLSVLLLLLALLVLSLRWIRSIAGRKIDGEDSTVDSQNERTTNPFPTPKPSAAIFHTKVELIGCSKQKIDQNRPINHL